MTVTVAGCRGRGKDKERTKDRKKETRSTRKGGFINSQTMHGRSWQLLADRSFGRPAGFGSSSLSVLDDCRGCLRCWTAGVRSIFSTTNEGQLTKLDPGTASHQHACTCVWSVRRLGKSTTPKPRSIG